MVRAWLKPTHHAWFAHASLIWLTSTSLYQNVLFEFPNRMLSLAPLTSGPRDKPRCGALTLLQKPLHYRGDSVEIAPSLNVKLWDPVAAWW
jgi:hypothetical protein